jgi:hypothetical protein
MQIRVMETGSVSTQFAYARAKTVETGCVSTQFAYARAKTVETGSVSTRFAYARTKTVETGCVSTRFAYARTKTVSEIRNGTVEGALYTSGHDSVRSGEWIPEFSEEMEFVC